MNYSNLNGRITKTEEALIPADNGAFRYGYGLIETLLVKDGYIELGQYHWERLFNGLQQLYFKLPVLYNPEYFENEVLKTVRKNKLEKLCRVRLQLFAAGGGLYSSEVNRPGYIIECFPLETDVVKLNANGLSVGMSNGLNKSIDSLSNMKTCNALIYAIAAKQARENKWNDALILNQHGNIIESTIANIFWIKNGNLFTPPLSEGCIAGITRRYITEQITVTEQKLTWEELLSANEVFLTNSIRRIKWIGYIANKPFSNEQIKQINRVLYHKE